MILDRLPFAEIWVVDFEFEAPDGERPRPICLVAKELRSDRLIRLWRDGLQRLPTPPYPTNAKSLFVAYYASAELNCHLALGWGMPERILDAYAEFRACTNGNQTIAGAGLLGALAAHGLDTMAATEKEDMRQLALRGGPFSVKERISLLDYCQSDVDALAKLLPAMLPEILDRTSSSDLSLGHALLRGRYMAAAARMEWTGIPIDRVTLGRLKASWEGIKSQLITTIDQDFGVFEEESFRSARFADYLSSAGIAWPRTPSGALDLKDDTFREMARAYPQIAPLRELRHALSQLRLNDLAVGSDGRNRTLLSAFRARTGRNQPSNKRFIFGTSVWLRGLIKPPQGYGLAYVDYSSQEIGIAAALSGDEALIEAYNSGDVYLGFAKQAGLAPPDATRQSHAAIRDRCKAIVLGTNYGMGAGSLAARIGQPAIVARDLLTRHHQTYPRFWQWSQAAVDEAMVLGRISTVFGWPIHVGSTVNPRSLMNFPMQANGAEMLRLACCLATEAGLEICAPIHDAILLAAPLDDLEDHCAKLRGFMVEASRIVLDGFKLRTDAKLVRFPDRYMDDRGEVMWNKVMALLDDLDPSHSNSGQTHAS